MGSFNNQWKLLLKDGNNDTKKKYTTKNCNNYKF